MAQQVSTHLEIPEHYRTTTGQSHRKVMMWTFLGSECMFFGSLLATFLIYHDNVVAGPGREEVLSSLALVSLMAFVLLASSFTMVLALSAARRGDEKMMRLWLLSTAFFGLFFIASQGYEFWSFINHKHLTPQTNLFGASFMTLTGFHGAHVTLGIIWLVSAALMVRLDPRKDHRPIAATMLPRFLRFLSGVPGRAPEDRVEVRPRHRRYAAFTREPVPQPAQRDAELMALADFEEEHERKEKVLNIELTGLYWHFVDVVWVVIFTVVYLMQ